MEKRYEERAHTAAAVQHSLEERLEEARKELREAKSPKREASHAAELRSLRLKNESLERALADARTEAEELRRQLVV